jgi:hypothetical protein
MSAAAHLKLSSAEFDVLLTWYKIRDTISGDNYTSLDVPKALELASECPHPKAVWLTSLFAGRHATTLRDVNDVLSAQLDHPLCFVEKLTFADSLIEGVQRGDALAQAVMAWEEYDQARRQYDLENSKKCFKGAFDLADKSARQGERNGFFWLGYFYKEGSGCELDVEKGKEFLLIASELGHVPAMKYYSELLNDARKYYWLGRAAERRFPNSFSLDMSGQIQKFNQGVGRSDFMFAIGRALKGNANEKAEQLFGSSFGYSEDDVTQVQSFYEFQLRSYRRAVDLWSGIAIRNGVVKDIRKMIAKIIWETRCEARYSM